MSVRETLTVKQVVVETKDGTLCGVVLPQVRMDMLIGFIADLSEGPISLVKLPGLKMVPVSELEADHPNPTQEQARE